MDAFGLFFPVPSSLFFSEIEVLMDGHPDRQVRSDMPSAPFETRGLEGDGSPSKTCLSIMYWCVRYYCLTQGETIKAAEGRGSVNSICNYKATAFIGP